ncbi:MAG TPA: tetratricopeptide repeat protein, partial [Geobacteraceae bacterium]|nr:tetratricopeptide repeat protein [Geobacteraceae bacterium]
QAMADRYTYIPLTGAFVIMTFGAVDAAKRCKLPPWILSLVGGIILAALSVQCLRQVNFWQDDVTLFSHAIAVTDGNWLAHATLAAGLIQKGNLDEADLNLLMALRYWPEYGKAIASRGFIAAQQGRHSEALGLYVKAVTLMPDDPPLYEAIGGEFLALGRYDGAEAALRRLRPLDPERALLLARRISEAAASRK